MSATGPARRLPEPRRFTLGGYVSGAAFSRDGAVAAFACGDGRLRLLDAATGADRDLPPAHKGAILSLVVDGDGHFVTGGDDGRLVRTMADGSTALLETFRGRFLDAVAAHPRTGAVAVGVGKEVRIVDDAAPLKFGPTPTSVAALAFSPDGTRLAAAHYGGVTIWNMRRPQDAPKKLVWKGAHIRLAYSPNGRFLASGMQENAIHCWRLADGSDMQMSGYPAKPKGLAWIGDSKFLVGTGAPGFVCWSFAGKGPEGRPPLEFASRDEPELAVVVAAHPGGSAAALGFQDGSVEIGELEQVKVLKLPFVFAAPASAVAWSPDGFRLAAGAENGEAALFDLRMDG